MKKLFVTVLFLSGCMGSSPSPSVVVGIDPPNIQDPPPLKLQAPQFVVVTSKNVTQVLTSFQKRGLEPVIVGMSVADYKLLAANLVQLREYLQRQKAIIDAYRQLHRQGAKK